MPRPIRITLNPDALDRNGISTAQTLTTGSPEPIIDGALASGYDVDAICVAQTTGAAAALTLNGAYATQPHLRRQQAERLVFTSTSDNSGITFAVVGADRNGAAVLETVTGSAASQKVFSDEAFWTITSITSSAAVTGNVEVGLNGWVTFAIPQHVTIWATSDESGGSFTITGTDRNDNVITESITGPTASATVVGSKNFKTVTHVVSPAAATGVEIGVDGTCESNWLALDRDSGDFGVALGIAVTGTINYTIQHTLDDLRSSGFDESGVTTYDHATLAAQTTTQDGNYSSPPIGIRLKVNSMSSGGSVVFTVNQPGG